jgi:hypothetical protein
MKRKLSFTLTVLLTALFLSVGVFAGANPKTPIGGQTSKAANYLSPDELKKEGTIRVGLAGVKTGAVGEGINAAALAGSIQNTLAQYLKGTRVEIVPLEARLAQALEAEAKEKNCQFILYATISHKKGGGGFGMLKMIAPVLGSVVPVAGVGGMIAGQIASTAINSSMGNVKAKDEFTLDIKLQTGGAAGAYALNKQFKAKAKSAGEDVVSPLVEQAAIALVEQLSK